MMKLVVLLVLLILIPPLISESFSYFDGDMISHNFENKDYDWSYLHQDKKMIQKLMGVLGPKGLE